MSDELSPEREKELVERAARFIVKHDMEDFAEMFLEGTAPFGDLIGNIGFMATYPFAVFFLGQTGSDLANMLGFNYKFSANKILGRVAELREEKKQRQEKLREEEKLKGKKRPFSFFGHQKDRSSSSPSENKV